MTNTSKIAIVGMAAFGALLGGCATTVETGPGYYHYDTRAAGSPPAIVHEAPAVVVHDQPAVVYRDAPVVYINPPVVYSNPPVVYSNPTVIYTDPNLRYRYPEASPPYQDHGQ
jgi:hypothetical protein